MERDLSGSSISNIDQAELLKSAKAKMGDVKEENERLKKLLAQIVMEYKSLEKQISLMHQTNPPNKTKNNSMDDDNGQDPELVSLTLGSWTSNNKEYDDDGDNSTNDWIKRRKIDEGLSLGLDCKFEYNNNTNVKSENDLMKHSRLDCKERKDSENMETWSPSGGLNKSHEKTNKEEDDHENLHQLPVKKTRVCIRSRCDTPTMHDGCQWRKYGQKIAKGNPCPRAYYRCTVSPTCPVRKQVQRYAQDMSILITTYEGTHNHPLPLSATAMASATSAAAAMIKTGPLTSQPPLMGPTTTTTTTSSLGNTFHTSPSLTMINTNPNNRSNIPTFNHSIISSSSHNHPTITLDLTTPNPIPSFHNNNYLSSPSIMPKNNTNNNIIPSSSSFLNFSSTSSTSSAPWPNSYLNYATLFPNNTINRNLVYQNPSSYNSPQQSLNETIAAVATKAIASNPNLQSVLAAAISSYVGNTNNNNNNNNNKINNENNNKDSNSEEKASSPNMQMRNSNAQLKLFPTSMSSPLSSTSNASATADSKDHVT